MSGVRMEKVSRDEDGLRLDRWFKTRYPNLGHGALQKMLRKGQIRLSGSRAQASDRVSSGDEIRVPPMPDAAPARKPAHDLAKGQAKEQLAEWTVYEDADVLVLNKPFGMAVQGGAKTREHIDAYLEAAGGEVRARLVHRLDKDTGGLLVTGKTRKSTQWLTQAFRERMVEKEYWALVKGVPQPLEGRIDASLEKAGPQGQEKARHSDDGKKAISDYQVIELAAQKASFVALRPITGRTHQLRAHMQLIGTPIVGDGKYGGQEAKLEGLPGKMHLFCRRLVVPRPGRKPLILEAPLTGHMKATWQLFAFDHNAKPEWPDDIR